MVPILIDDLGGVAFRYQFYLMTWGVGIGYQFYL